LAGRDAAEFGTERTPVRDFIIETTKAISRRVEGSKIDRGGFVEQIAGSNAFLQDVKEKRRDPDGNVMISDIGIVQK
jgi:hypothetical protein